jgi:hypothetical protein
VQWRIPIGFQLVPVGIMLCFLPFLKESPRWLATKHREDAALDNLAWIRKASPDDPDVQAEFAEIVAAIREEEHASKGSSWREIFAKGNPIRFIIAFLIFTFQQVSERASLAAAPWPVEGGEADSPLRSGRARTVSLTLRQPVSHTL